jgi:hypothetical protein
MQVWHKIAKSSRRFCRQKETPGLVAHREDRGSSKFGKYSKDFVPDETFGQSQCLLAQHPFCKSLPCWCCAAGPSVAMRALAPEERRTVQLPRRPGGGYREVISSGHFDPQRRRRPDGPTRRTSSSRCCLLALLDRGLDGAGEALRILVNEASKIERTWFLVRRSKPARSRWCKSATVKD